MDIPAYKEIGENRFIEEKGLFFEDFVVGSTIVHWPGRTVTEADNIWQSLINMNQHPLHIDNAYGSDTEFGKVLVSSLVTFNIINGMTVHSISHRCIANLGWEDVKLTAPVFVGDSIYAETTILNKRVSKKRPTQGIVTVKTIGLNQDKKQVIEFTRNVLIPMKENN